MKSTAMALASRVMAVKPDCAPEIGGVKEGLGASGMDLGQEGIGAAKGRLEEPQG